jgi:hypothetical protein
MIAMRALRHGGRSRRWMVRACLMMEKIMTRGMELDEVNGDKRNLAPTILDDADLEVVSGADMETTMLRLGVWGLYGAEKGAVARHR